MPERTGDDQGTWRYDTVYPGADLKLNPIAIRMPELVEAVGLDGRFGGALRPFPGMADKTVHGVPPPSGSTTITAINNVFFAKYASIQKGTSGDTLKGIVFLADNLSGSGKAVYFSYRDSSDGSEDVVMLEDLDSWTDFKVTSIKEHDITSQGRYIYLSLSTDTTSTVTQFSGKEPPYNKAYFWDFKINSFDKFVVGFDQRFMGLMPNRVLGSPLNEDDDGTFGLDSSDQLEAQIYGSGVHLTPQGNYTFAAELISRKHKLRSWFRFSQVDQSNPASSAVRWRVNSYQMPTNAPATTQQIKGNGNEGTGIIHWGIPHVDGVRIWRTAVNDLGRAMDKYTIVSNFHLVDEYLELDANHTDSGIIFSRIDHDSRIDIIQGEFKSTWFEDRGLLSQDQYFPFTHTFHPTPRFKRIHAHDGLLVGITDIAEPASPDKLWDDIEKIPEAIIWSTIVLDEPENFPPENNYRPDDAAEKFFALEPAGDHLFAVSNAGVYRITRSGSILGVNRMHFRVGAVGRFGITGIGNTLYVVTTAGLKSIDGNTGQIESVTAFDRVILDDSEWAGTLSSVHLEYDAKIGALVMLNTSKKEAYILWESTGAITKLEDIPWTFLTAGPDVLTDGPHRVYFITDAATIHVIDGAREMGKRSMCGTLATETVNGTTSLAGPTSITVAGAVFPLNCVGFRVHFLDGTGVGTSSIITVRTSDTQITFNELSPGPSVGDRFSIAPIVTRITLPQMVSQGGQEDIFVRKVIVTMGAAFSDLGGETGGGDVNGNFNFGVKDMTAILTRVEKDFNLVPDKTFVHIPTAAVRLFPFLEMKGGNQDWELQAVIVKGQLTISEAQSRQV